MAETTTNTNQTSTILSLYSTTNDNLKNIAIKNGQLLFVHDAGKIALDLHGKRTFYNQVIELDAEYERINLSNPVNGKYYFIIETAIFWRYFNGWIQLTASPDEIIFIGAELPELGQPNKLYVNKVEKEISIWDEDTEGYIPVSNYTETLTPDDVNSFWEETNI